MSRGTAASRGFWPLRDLPVAFWLLAVLVTSVVHPFLPAPRWLMIHLLLLGALTHAILVWSRYFADALLHTAPGPADRRVQNRRLLLLNGGVLAVIAGVLGDWWPVALLGGASVAAAVVWHGAALALRLRRALPARFAPTVRYYVAAACFLPVGAGLGTALARGVPGPWHDRMVVAHTVVNLLGWIGLPVIGTLVTLWPTMLRTRIAEGAERAAARALPLLVLSLLLAAGGALAGLRLAAAAGVIGYLAGLALLARPFVAAARGKAPSSYPTWSVLAGVLWLVGCLGALAVGVAAADTWSAAGKRLDGIVPFLAAGFGAQILLGALSYLVPVALGGGPGPTRVATAALERAGALRIVLVNAGLVVCAVPVPGPVRVLVSTLVLAGLAAFLPLLAAAIRSSRRAKQALRASSSQPAGTSPPPRTGTDRARGQNSGLVASGLASVALAVAIGLAVDPAGPAGVSATSASVGAVATGETTTVAVTARDMRFSPGVIEVPAGNRLVIVLSNADEEEVHDLVLDSGDRSGRLAPGESARMDVGVVGRDLTGWCSVVGHRQMGMVLRIEVTGEPATGPDAAGPDAAGPDAGRDGGSDAAGGSDAPVTLDFMADPGAGFTAHDAALPPIPEQRLHRHTFTVRDVVRAVAPGVTQRLWTFDGTAPGPVLHGRVGDAFEITLVNGGSVGHSIDFHAGALAPDGPTRTIPPSESLVYRFQATRAGVWMYHCSTMPMSAHIANGLFGAVVIDPPDLPPVDRSYLLVQSELYLGGQGGLVDMTKLQAEAPDAVVFNGYANQYDHRPLPARAGERVRVWVLDAGPNRATSFHVVGAQFDTTYREGHYLLRGGPGGSQSLSLAPAQGGFVELTFPEPGRYPFVSHIMIDAERGAHGIFDVTG